MFQLSKSVNTLKQRKWFVLVLLLHVVLAYLYIAQRDICADEPDYIEYAKHWLHGNPDRSIPLYDSKTPVVAIAWLPRIVQQLQHKNLEYNDWGKSDQMAGRYMMVVFTLLTAWYIYKFSKKLLSKNWQLLPVVLFLFDPLVLGHSGIIGSDIACAFAYTAVLYHLWQYLEASSFKQLIFTSIFIGFACIVKQNLILLAFALPITLLIKYYFRNQIKHLFSLKSFFSFFLYCSIVLLVVNVAFFGKGCFKSLNEYHFQSTVFNVLQQKAGILANAPMPLPAPFIQGYDMISYHSQIGGATSNSTYNGIYILDNFSSNNGFWYYYIVSFFFKMPIVILSLIFIGVILLGKRIISANSVSVATWLMLCIGASYFVVLSFFNPFQIGIRHLIFLLPCLYILIAKLIQHICIAEKVKFILLFMGLLNLVSIATYFNNYIPYTNEFATNKIKIVEWLRDSNIDYGQNNTDAAKFVKQHKLYKQPSAIADTGLYAVRAFNVLYVNNQLPDTLAWLRNYKPFDVYRGTVWLYNITSLK